MTSVSSGDRFRWVAAIEMGKYGSEKQREAGYMDLPFVNCLSFVISPVSNISVSFSIVSCSTIQFCNSSCVGRPGTSFAKVRMASKPIKTSIGGSDSKNYDIVSYMYSFNYGKLTLIFASIHAFLSLNVWSSITSWDSKACSSPAFTNSGEWLIIAMSLEKSRTSFEGNI